MTQSPMDTLTESAPRHSIKSRRPLVEGQEFVLIVVIALVWVGLSLATSTFWTAGNIQTILYSVAPIAIIGVGMTAIMVTAGIDVSVGSQLAVVTASVALMLKELQWGIVLTIVAALVIGGVLGTINALLIVKGKIHPMIVTFGTLNIFRFVALQIFGDSQIPGVPGTFSFVGGSASAVTLGIPNAMWLAVILVLIQWFYMRAYSGGRHVYAIGNDSRAARLAGINVDRKLMILYITMGLLVAVAALVQLGAGGLVQQNVGIGLEMKVIAACVIGGTSVLGGRGTVLGTLLGALLVGTVTSAITLLGWSSELTNLFVGVFIIIAVGIDLLRQRRRAQL